MKPQTPAELAELRPAADPIPVAPAAPLEPEVAAPAAAPELYRVGLPLEGNLSGSLNLAALTAELGAALGLPAEKIAVSAILEAGKRTVTTAGKVDVETVEPSITVESLEKLDYDAVRQVLRSHKADKTDAEVSAEVTAARPSSAKNAVQLEQVLQKVAILEQRLDKLEGRLGGKG